MKNIATVCVLLSLLLPASVFSQKYEIQRKGKFFFYWGYNRAAFTNSDINFTGPGYDFTLQAVQANDRPQEFTFKEYFGITTMWQPQYVYRFGYFINDKWSISIGLDHMKYIMPQYQQVQIRGEINQEGNPFNGSYGEGDAVWMWPPTLSH